MARVRTLRDRVKQIKRKYERVTAYKFLYNKKSELRRRYKRIRVWILIRDPRIGYSIMDVDVKRSVFLSVDQWRRHFSRPLPQKKYLKSKQKHSSIYNVFTQALLPAINNKGGNEWRFISLLGWAGVHDLRQNKNPRSSAPNKRTKKRTSNARTRGRRRY